MICIKISNGKEFSQRKRNNCLFLYVINSREAIAEAIVGLLMVFYNSNNFFFKMCSHIFMIFKVKLD